mgnify:CR=1 FL=1|tara:strand:+ start:60 stop:527 length:468 start_codon:yes stop_codon:yes gene_type:complete
MLKKQVFKTFDFTIVHSDINAINGMNDLLRKPNRMSAVTDWPADDVNGDVLRLLEQRNFDFNSDHEIEFIIDFKGWPLTKTQQAIVLDKLPKASFVDSNSELMEAGDPSGYLSFKVKRKLTYDFVVFEMKRLSNLFAELDGFCDSWCVVSGCGSI